jgi:rRNA maturation endonuclease Nob1
MVWIDGSIISTWKINSVKVAIQWAKKTGDYAVLSQADLCVLALTYALDQEDKQLRNQTASSFLMNIAIQVIFLIVENEWGC